MERSTPVRKPHTSTADLLTWGEAPSSASSNASAQRSSGRSIQPSDGISKVLFGGQVTDDEAKSLLKKKPCSGNKMKEMTGSGIFAANGANAASEPIANPTNKTGLRIYQQAVNGMSQISFSADGSVSPKKPTSLPEVAKQLELSGTLQTESDAKNKKQISTSKYKEISGHDIFAPSDEIKPRSLAAAHSMESRESKDVGEPAPRNVRTCQSFKFLLEIRTVDSVVVPSSCTSCLGRPAGGQTSILLTEEPVVKTAKKIHNQKFQELTGNDIFKGDVPPGSAEKPLSRAKLREMSGNDIFSDGKAKSRDYLGGVRKPPGGESSIALV